MKNDLIPPPPSSWRARNPQLKKQKMMFPVSGLVKICATFNLVGMYVGEMSPSSYFSHTKWQSNSVFGAFMINWITSNVSVA